jgi:alanine racemase
VPRPTVAEVRLDAVRHNLAALRRIVAPGVKVLGVVKADAYGHGLVPVARALESAGIDMLGVVMVEEGVALRQAGLALPILMMGTIPQDETEALLAHDLRPTVGDVETLDRLDRAARAAGKRAAAHLKVDTGMNRLGVRSEEAVALAERILGRPSLLLEGVYTHFACADTPGDRATREQLKRFRAVLAELGQRGTTIPMIHAANSSALATMPETHFDMVRPGLALYGLLACRAPEGLDLRPALSLKTRVAHLKPVPRGDSVSYGHTWRAERDSLLGVLPIGYADGYPRALSNKGQVRIGEGADAPLCPVVGHICMDATLVDLTGVPGVRVGLEATLIEARADSPLSAAAVARRADTIPYEILTGLGARVPRVYV